MNLTTLVIIIPFTMSIGQAMWAYSIFKKYDITLKRTWNLNIYSKKEWEQIEQKATELGGEKKVRAFRSFYNLHLLSWIILVLWFLLTIFI